MSKEAFFICTECGSNVLAISHNWREKTRFEEGELAQLHMVRYIEGT